MGKNKISSEIKYFKTGYSLSKIFKRFHDSKFHIGSSTGIDTFAFHQNKPTGLTNVALGGGMPSIFYPDKCIVLPFNLYCTKEKKILSIKSYLNLLLKLQKKHFLDRFEIEYQKKFKVKYISNSEDEIYNLIHETELLSRNKLKLKKNDQVLQKKFWNIYPDKWFAPSIRNTIFNKKENQILVSPYYLRKYKNLLYS